VHEPDEPACFDTVVIVYGDGDGGRADGVGFREIRRNASKSV